MKGPRLTKNASYELLMIHSLCDAPVPQRDMSFRRRESMALPISWHVKHDNCHGPGCDEIRVWLGIRCDGHKLIVHAARKRKSYPDSK
jgi:hypothetical protein